MRYSIHDLWADSEKGIVRVVTIPGHPGLRASYNADAEGTMGLYAALEAIGRDPIDPDAREFVDAEDEG